MYNKVISEPIGKVLKELSAIAEKQIEEELEKVCRQAIEQHHRKIINDVTNKYKVACNSALVQMMDSAGMALQFTFVPKEKQGDDK